MVKIQRRGGGGGRGEVVGCVLLLACQTQACYENIGEKGGSDKGNRQEEWKETSSVWLTDNGCNYNVVMTCFWKLLRV